MDPIKFPKIRQFREAVREVRAKTQFCGLDEAGVPIMDRDAKMPTIEYVGTVKMHGTNASVRLTQDEEVFAQSKNQVLTPDIKDNHGWRAYSLDSIGKDFWIKTLSEIKQEAGTGIDCEIVVYGEYIGKSIAKGAAVCLIPDNLFVVFAVRIKSKERTIWLDDNFISKFNFPEYRIYNSTMFDRYSITIDFNDLEPVREELQRLTDIVEKCCPVAKELGVEGTGEGIVWRPIYSSEFHKGEFWFKTKGQKHMDSGKCKKNKVDISPEKLKNIDDFVSYCITDVRLEKGIAYLVEMDIPLSRKSTGQFLKWIGNDVLDEESDTLEESGLEIKDITGKLNQAARSWYFKYLDKMVFE